MKPHQFRRVLLHVRYELNRFQSALQKLESCEFPSSIALTLVEQQQAECRAASMDLDQIETDVNDDPDGSAARLVSEFRKMVSRRRYLEVLEKARSDEVPWSLVPSIETLSNQILPTYNVLITTTPDMNYMVGWGANSATIYLPRLHRANGFLHVLIGHELFHPIVTEFFVIEKPKYKPRLRDLCQKHLAKMGIPSDLFFQQRLDALLDHATQQWEKAMTELMCDMGATALFGPAALWTLSGFAATQDMNSPPAQQFQYYPPWRMRIRVVLDFMENKLGSSTLLENLSRQLQQAGLGDHATALAKSISDEQISFVTSELAQEPLRELSVQVYDLVEECISDAGDFVLSKAKNFPNRWTETQDEVPVLLNRLLMHVPPSELLEGQKQESKAASMSGIVMACWLERLRLEDSGQLNLDTFRRLCRLMLKAIEDAELKRKFSDWASSK